MQSAPPTIPLLEPVWTQNFPGAEAVLQAVTVSDPWFGERDNSFRQVEGGMYLISKGGVLPVSFVPAYHLFAVDGLLVDCETHASSGDVRREARRGEKGRTRITRVQAASIQFCIVQKYVARWWEKRVARSVPSCPGRREAET